MLTSKEIKHIINIANSFREALNINEGIFCLEEIVCSLNGKINCNCKGVNVSELLKVNNLNFTINLEDEKYKRYNIAYELGNLVLNGRYLIDMNYWNSIEPGIVIPKKISYVKSNEYCQEFALAFLLSQSTVNLLIDYIMDDNIEKISMLTEIPENLIIKKLY